MQSARRQVSDPVIAVSASSAETAWPYVEEWIKKACEPAGYTSDYILEQIQSRQMQLWIGEQFGCVTQVHTLPLWNTLVIVLLGGENMSDWFEDLIVQLEDWGRQIGCQYVECHGRKGWEKIGKPLDYKPIRMTFRKEL